MGNVHKLKENRLKGDPYIETMPIKHGKHLGASAYEWAIVRGRQQGIGDNASMLDSSTKE